LDHRGPDGGVRLDRDFNVISSEPDDDGSGDQAGADDD
jgi:hypothetical protein